jgi:hypothetical protein
MINATDAKIFKSAALALNITPATDLDEEWIQATLFKIVAFVALKRRALPRPSKSAGLDGFPHAQHSRHRQRTVDMREQGVAA